MSQVLLVNVLALGLLACSSAPAKERSDAQQAQSAASAAVVRTMQALIHFAHDQTDLSDSARTILDEKVAIFRANPELRIAIVGYASEPGTVAYNRALGTQRAEAAKRHLVARGISPSRIEIVTRGEGQLVVEGPGEAADAQNRRDEFRLLITSHEEVYLASPQE